VRERNGERGRDIWCQFHQRSKSSFYERRSQKRKKDCQVKQLYCLHILQNGIHDTDCNTVIITFVTLFTYN